MATLARMPQRAEMRVSWGPDITRIADNRRSAKEQITTGLQKADLSFAVRVNC
jgi:hypothetical protein